MSLFRPIVSRENSVLKLILFRINIRRNSSAEYSAETDIAKLAHYSSCKEYSFLTEHSVNWPNIRYFAEYLA